MQNLSFCFPVPTVWSGCNFLIHSGRNGPLPFEIPVVLVCRTKYISSNTLKTESFVWGRMDIMRTCVYCEMDCLWTSSFICRSCSWGSDCSVSHSFFVRMFLFVLWIDSVRAGSCLLPLFITWQRKLKNNYFNCLQRCVFTSAGLCEAQCDILEKTEISLFSA